MPLTDEQLPLKSEAKLPAQWRPRVSAVVVRAAAVIAVGALSEVLARRAIGEAGRRAAGVVRLPVRQSKSVADSANTEPTLLSETVYMRRIQMRR